MWRMGKKLGTPPSSCMAGQTGHSMVHDVNHEGKISLCEHIPDGVNARQERQTLNQIAATIPSFVLQCPARLLRTDSGAFQGTCRDKKRPADKLLTSCTSVLWTQDLKANLRVGDQTRAEKAVVDEGSAGKGFRPL